MKVNAKRIIAVLLAAALILGLAACSIGNNEDEQTPVENNNVVNATVTDYLVAEKIGTVNRDSFRTENGGLTYSEGGLYGVISYEGLYDTGAKFSYVSAREKYFMVRENNPSSETDIAALNSAYLINGRGEPVVPGTYAAYEILNDRFVLAAKATQYTYDENKTVLTYDAEYGSTKTTSFIVYEDEAWYEGTWDVYDITTGALVPGATGNTRMDISADGAFLRFSDPVSGNAVTINANGEPAPAGAYVFADGSYKLEGRIGEVYAADGTKLFSYDLTGYIPEMVFGEYYAASKYVDGTTTYAVMNNKGEILSEGYDGSGYDFEICGDLVFCNDKVYNLQGENIIEGTYTSIRTDKIFGNNYLLHVDGEYTMIDVQGNVLYTDKDSDEVSIHSDYFVATKQINGDYYFYSHKDKDYTIKGYSFAPWIVQTNNANSMYDLVDTMTGETILEGYSDYGSIPYGANAYYVYATYNGGADVYLIISSSQITEITETKTNLYDDLAAAFEAQGITVAINRDSGEIALDTAVLFGGDSAVLTDEGKAVLNKFMAAYTTVVYSEEYNGFITKTLVEGHAAPLAGSTYASGYDLSVERATNVMNYCLSAEAGVDAGSPIANTMEAVGYSNSQPIYNENGEVNLEASRRVSFRFMVNIEF